MTIFSKRSKTDSILESILGNGIFQGYSHRGLGIRVVQDADFFSLSQQKTIRKVC